MKYETKVKILVNDNLRDINSQIHSFSSLNLHITSIKLGKKLEMFPNLWIHLQINGADTYAGEKSRGGSGSGTKTSNFNWETEKNTLKQFSKWCLKYFFI